MNAEYACNGFYIYYSIYDGKAMLLSAENQLGVFFPHDRSLCSKLRHVHILHKNPEHLVHILI